MSRSPTLDQTVFSTLTRHPLRVRRLKVVDISHPTPRLCRVVLGGSELAGFVSLAPDDHVKVLFPKRGQDEPVVPQVVDGHVVWPQGELRPIARDYTPVHYDEAARTLELHIVLHGSGHASSWAEQAHAGNVLAVAGPRGSHVLRRVPESLLLAGDETALPAITRWLGELTPETAVRAVIEVSDPAEERALVTRANADVQWVYRRENPGHALQSAIERAVLPQALDHAWIAGESAAVRSIRQHLMERSGLLLGSISARGYWKSGVKDYQEPHED